MFSKGSLRAQRFLVATQSVTPDKVEHVSRQLWMRVWSRVCNIILLEGAKFTSLSSSEKSCCISSNTLKY